MNWKNEEQYSDYTAEEAMFRVMHPDAERTRTLDDEGCLLLVEAIVRQAVEDHFTAKRTAETEAFFRSDYFRCLTGVDGKTVIRMIRKEMKKE